MVSSAWSARGASYATSELHKSGPSLAKLLALARPNTFDCYLDLGTGAGHTAAALADYAAQVVGLDVAAGMLRAAGELYQRQNPEFIQAPAQATGLPSESFDIITARHTLHHHPDPAATLIEAARLLKPGGRLVIADEVTPDAAVNNTVDAWWDTLERIRDHTHVRAYTLGEWQSFIAGSGLAWVVGDSKTRYPIDVKSWLERMKLDELTTEAAYDLLASADAYAREIFEIEYEGAWAVRFQLPVALILAVKPVLSEDDIL